MARSRCKVRSTCTSCTVARRSTVSFRARHGALHQRPTDDLKEIAKKFGKKFACGSSITTDEIYGEVLTVQGDIEYDLIDYLEQDKAMIALNIPIEKIVFEDKGNKKGRKRA